MVGLWQDKDRSSAEVKRIATEHVAELRTKIAELAGMCEALEHLAAACQGDHRPECPILHELEGRGAARRSEKPATTGRHAADFDGQAAR